MNVRQERSTRSFCSLASSNKAALQSSASGRPFAASALRMQNMD
jgi:hypothetical protein